MVEEGGIRQGKASNTLVVIVTRTATDNSFQKGAIVKYRFSLNQINKPVNAMFVGTSPELEVALYTVCFEVRPDKECPISLGGNKLLIRTHTFRYRGKNLIGSAFPEI